MRVITKAYRLLPTFVRRPLTKRVKTMVRDMNVVRLPLDFSMDLDPWEWLQSALSHGDLVEPKTIDRILSLLGPGDVYVDVGAHVGLQTLVARTRVGPSGRVVAIEPQPANCAKLLTNWRLNGYENIVTYVAAASDSNSLVTLHDQGPGDRSRLSLEGASSRDEPQKFVVPAVRLDDVLAAQNIDTVKLLKIDAEAHDLAVLRGLGDRISSVRNIIVEVYDPQQPDYVELVALLRGAGFSLRTVDDEPWHSPAPLPELNLLAMR